MIKHLSILMSLLTSLTMYNSEFKSYMHYEKIVTKTSEQYKLQQNAYNKGVFRMYNDCYMIAVGTGWGFVVSDYVDVKLDTGVILKCIIGDIKQDVHTDSSNRFKIQDGYFRNGKQMINVIEFIVCDINETMAKYGDISKVDSIFEGNVVNIVRRTEDEN